MTKLYNFQFNNQNLVDINNMYVRGGKYIIENNILKILNNGNVVFNTYFNAFSIEKWKKYTNLSSVFLNINVKGKCKIVVYNNFMQAGDFLNRVLLNRIEENKVVKIDLSSYLDCLGLISISVEAIDAQVELSDMFYFTEDEVKPVKLAIGICTYKRESYIYKFIENFENFEENLNIEVFISDNAKTLRRSSNSKIHIFDNKNYGGAGGFGRCMYEVRQANLKNDSKFTHLVLMDDDLFIDFHIFEKMISFLSLLRDEYKLHFLAGAMCSLDQPYLQYEKCSEFNGWLRQWGANYNLNDKNTIIVNERDEKLGTASIGWWCSCFSVDMLTPNNYPFPCFFRGDDIEFSLRNGSKLITLNGINVWHEPFYKKYSISSECYYLMRNLLVIDSLYFPKLDWKSCSREIRNRFKKCIFTYDYRGAELLIEAMLDFSKGSDFFLSENYNPEKFNSELMKKNYKLESIDKLLEQYRIDDINYHVYFRNIKDKFHEKLRKYSLNGYILPKFLLNRTSFAHIGFGGRLVSYYRSRKVMVFDPFTKTGYYVEMDKLKAVKLCLNFWKVYKKTERNFSKIKADYQSNFWKMQTENFWKKLLGV